MPPLTVSRPRFRHALAVGLACASLLACACGFRDSAESADPAAEKASALREGDERFARQQFAEAAAAYQRAVNADAMDGEARLKLARAYLRAARWDRAAREAIRAADLLPGNRDAEVLAVSSLIGLGSFDEAVNRASADLRLNPNDAEFLFLLGNARAQLLAPTWALMKFEEAWRQGRDAGGVPLTVRRTTTEANDRAAREAFQRALEIDPTLSDARLSFAGFLWVIGRFDEGAAVLKSVADEYPEHSFLSRALGLCYVSIGRDADGEKYLKVAASSNDRDSRLALSDFYIAKGRDEEALAILDPMSAAADPENAVTFRAAAIELRLGRHERALQRADKVLAAEPFQPVALRLKAQALLAALRIDEALKLANDAIRSSPRSSDARAVLALCLKQSGDPARAFDEFAEAFRLDPTNHVLPGELADLALTLGRDQVALDFARQSVKLRPSKEASTVLIKVLIRTRDFAAADQALAPLLSRDQGSPDLLLLLAAIQAGRGNRSAARSTYQRALAADRNSLEAVSGLVALDLADRQIASARDRVDREMAAHPNDTAYLFMAVQVAVAEGNAQRTEAALRKIVELDPANADAAIRLAEVQARQGRRDDARRTVEEAIARRPSSIELQMAQAKLFEEAGQIADARARYEAILAKDPNAHAASARLAAIYAELGGDRLDIALTLATAAKRNLPVDAAVSDILGWVYVRRGVAVLAVPHLEDAVRRDPANPSFRYHLGVAYQLGNQDAKARAELNRALALDPNFPGAAAARLALSALQR